MKSIYKNQQAKEELMALYEEKLASLGIDYVELDVNTQFGNTRVIKAGVSKRTPIVLFHGINAGSPLTLEAVKNLTDQYQIFAIDTIGQVSKSAETTLNIKDDSYAIWANEVLAQLQLETANMIGISYGAYILQKLITHKPERVNKCIFIVPSGIVNGNFWQSMTQLTFPLIRFMITKKEQHLKAFTKAFVPEGDDFMLKMQRLLLLGVNIDYRRPVLLTPKDVQHFNNPVYMMEASNDIFFPGKEAEKRAQQLFKNLKEVYFLKNTLHMPGKETYPEIQMKLREWLE